MSERDRPTDGDGEAPEQSDGRAPGGDGGGPRRTAPLSVRELMRETEAGRGEAEHRAEPPPPRERTVEEPDGRRWKVEAAGAARSGWPTDSGAPLLLLVFRPEGEGSEGDREAMVVARGLEELGDEDLLEILAERSRPHRSGAAKPATAREDPPPRRRRR